MKVGMNVPYIDADGKRHTGTVDEITGTGQSHYKTLNIRYSVDGEELIDTDVPHQGDAAQGSAFWLVPGEKRIRDTDDEPLEAEPTVETRAFPETGIAAPPTAEAPAPRRTRSTPQ